MMKVTMERKAVARRLAELIGADVVYTRVPRCAYVVGMYIFEKDGSITVDEGADVAPLCTLAAEGLIEGFEAAPAREDAQDDQYDDHKNNGDPHGGTADVACADNHTDGAPETDDSPDTLTISLPLAGHTANSLRNLVAMIYARGALISKATGGTFSATAEQVDALHDCLEVEDVRQRLRADLVGITVDDEHVNFTGFVLPDDPEKVHAFSNLAIQMNKAAKAQKRVTAKPVESENERYLFRTWLLAIGMHGDEFATTRRILLAPLSGKAAFNDAAMEERWKTRQAEKHDALRRAKEASQG